MDQPMNPSDVVLARLEDQIQWYDTKSASAQKMYKITAVTATVSAALVPMSAGLKMEAWITGGIGVVVLVCQLLLKLNSYEQNWINYRSTCEALKHEKYLFLAQAGPYKDTDGATAELAERVESLISVEHAKWLRSVMPKKPEAPES